MTKQSSGAARKQKLPPIPPSLAAEFLSTALAELTKAGIAVRIGNAGGSAVVILPGLSGEIVDGAAVFTVLAEKDGTVAAPVP